MSDIAEYRKRQAHKRKQKWFKIVVDQIGYKVFEILAPNREEAISRYQQGEAKCIKTEVGENGIVNVEEVE